MATLDNILTLLDKWPAWRRIRVSPDRLDAVELRLEELESTLARCPAEGCPYCGELAMRMDRHRGQFDWWKCGECGKEIEKPSAVAAQMQRKR